MKGYIGCCLFLSGYRYLCDGGTDRREILHDDTCRSRTDLIPFGPKSWPLDWEYLENGKSQRYMSIRA